MKKALATATMTALICTATATPAHAYQAAIRNNECHLSWDSQEMMTFQAAGITGNGKSVVKLGELSGLQAQYSKFYSEALSALKVLEATNA